MTDPTETMFDEDWYAHQFALAVERKEPWAVFYFEEIKRVMKIQLNDMPLFSPIKND